MFLIFHIEIVPRRLKLVKKLVYFGKDLDEWCDDIKIYLKIYLMKISYNFQDRTWYQKYFENKYKDLCQLKISINKSGEIGLPLLVSSKVTSK